MACHCWGGGLFEREKDTAPLKSKWKKKLFRGRNQFSSKECLPCLVNCYCSHLDFFCFKRKDMSHDKYFHLEGFPPLVKKLKISFVINIGVRFLSIYGT